MNVNLYSSNIKDLKICYIVHFVLYGIIILFNALLIIEIIWLQSLYYYIYISLNIFGIIYLLSPIIPFIYIILKKITQKRAKKCKIITVIFCVLVIITGLSFSIILMINALESVEYCQECPFNLDNSYIYNIYDNYVNHMLSEKELKLQCTNRRCMFNNIILDNQYKYEYICNYEPTVEFDTLKNNSGVNQINQIICEKIEKKNINNYFFEKEDIIKFLKMCNSYNDFYMCQRINEPKPFYVKDNKCPEKNYLTYLTLFCLVSVLLNLILGFIPWKIEFNKFRSIMMRIRIHNNREGSKSLNSTQNNSKIQKEEIQNSFKKEPTEIIIVYNETNQNFVTNTDNSKDNDDEFVNNNKNKTSDLYNSNNININNKASINKRILDRYNINVKKKNNNDKRSNNEKLRKDDSIKILKISDNHRKNKNSKKNKENELFQSNSQRITYNSERNIFEESKSVPEIKYHN